MAIHNDQPQTARQKPRSPENQPLQKNILRVLRDLRVKKTDCTEEHEDPKGETFQSDETPAELLRHQAQV